MSINGKHWYRFVYLKSDEWKGIRLSVLASRKGRCCVCRVQDPSNDVHHVYYEIRNPKKSIMEVLCRKCHDAVHRHLNPTKVISPKEKRDARVAFNLVKEAMKHQFAVAAKQDEKAIELKRNPELRSGPRCSSCGRTKSLRGFNPLLQVDDDQHVFKVCDDCVSVLKSASQPKFYTTEGKAWNEIRMLMQQIRAGKPLDEIKSLGEVLRQGSELLSQK